MKPTALASSDELTHMGNEVRFDTAAARILGRRYYDAFQSLTCPQPGMPALPFPWRYPTRSKTIDCPEFGILSIRATLDFGRISERR